VVVPAYGKPPAPGAPGAIHVWAPADKHGFGTAHQLDSKAWFTVRQGSLSEVYYPDLSTPGFRGLQFAVSDGKGLLQRETADDDPRHIEPLADGVTSRVEAVPGSLEFRQITEGTGWRLTKTWITDPARATVLVRVRFESLRRAARSGTGSPTTATASSSTGTTGTCSSTTRRGRHAGAYGRCSPASAASTN
jgi:glucoamylase